MLSAVQKTEYADVEPCPIVTHRSALLLHVISSKEISNTDLTSLTILHYYSLPFYNKALKYLIQGYFGQMDLGTAESSKEVEETVGSSLNPEY